MIVWMNTAGIELGAPDGVLPREAVQRLSSLQDIHRQVQAECESHRAQAQAEASRLVDAAREEAARITQRALQDGQASARLGYARGQAEALDLWHAQAAERRREALRRHRDLRERLADLVVQATRRLVDQCGRESFYDSALATLDALAEQSRALTLSVHPDDEPAAQAALARRGARWPDGTLVKLATDARLQPRSCVCESDRGFVDASLSQQLAGLARAAAEALRLQDVPTDHPDDGP